MENKNIKNNEKNNVEPKKERPQNKNLKPIKPGEKRNPNGRPKGKLNYDTRVDMAIEILAQKYVREHNKKNPKKQITIDDVDIEGDIFQQHINKARAGDRHFIDSFLDRRHGKATQKVELTGKDGGAIEYKQKMEEAKSRLLKFQDRWFKKV